METTNKCEQSAATDSGAILFVDYVEQKREDRVVGLSKEESDQYCTTTTPKQGVCVVFRICKVRTLEVTPP